MPYETVNIGQLAKSITLIDKKFPPIHTSPSCLVPYSLSRPHYILPEQVGACWEVWTIQYFFYLQRLECRPLSQTHALPSQTTIYRAARQSVRELPLTQSSPCQGLIFISYIYIRVGNNARYSWQADQVSILTFFNLTIRCSMLMEVPP